MIVDNCPICNRPYGWDACQDTYPKAKEETAVIAGREVTLYLCHKDGGIIAVTVTDGHLPGGYGSQVYIPSTKDVS